MGEKCGWWRNRPRQSLTAWPAPTRQSAWWECSQLPTAVFCCSNCLGFVGLNGETTCVVRKTPLWNPYCRYVLLLAPSTLRLHIYSRDVYRHGGAIRYLGSRCAELDSWRYSRMLEYNYRPVLRWRLALDSNLCVTAYKHGMRNADACLNARTNVLMFSSISVQMSPTNVETSLDVKYKPSTEQIKWRWVKRTNPSNDSCVRDVEHKQKRFSVRMPITKRKWS